MAKMKSASERFWALVTRAPNGSCLDWIGAKDQRGYGRFNIANKAVLAHRVSYEQRHGAITSASLVLHDCDRPQCVNTAHLRVGTHKDNSSDCVNRNRLPRGSKKTQAKLTENDIPIIREMLRSGGSYNQIGKDFGVNHGTIKDISNGRTWCHVPIGRGCH